MRWPWESKERAAAKPVRDAADPSAGSRPTSKLLTVFEWLLMVGLVVVYVLYRAIDHYAPATDVGTEATDALRIAFESIQVLCVVAGVALSASSTRYAQRQAAASERQAKAAEDSNSLARQASQDAAAAKTVAQQQATALSKSAEEANKANEIAQQALERTEEQALALQNLAESIRGLRETALRRERQEQLRERDTLRPQLHVEVSRVEMQPTSQVPKLWVRVHNRSSESRVQLNYLRLSIPVESTQGASILQEQGPVVWELDGTSRATQIAPNRVKEVQLMPLGRDREWPTDRMSATYDAVTPKGGEYRDTATVNDGDATSVGPLAV